MRVLFFAWTPLDPKAPIHGYNGGGWVGSLHYELSKRGMELGFTFLSDRDEWYEHNGYSYYAVKREAKTLKERILVGLNPRNVSYETKRDEICINKFINVIEDFHPDVIHIFGSEQCYGLITKHINVPVVIHIQGILNCYWNAFLVPGISLSAYCLQSINPKKIWGRYQEYMEWYRTCAREQEILKHCRYFIGRTDWDKYCLNLFAKDYKYFYGSEMLRTEFYNTLERIQPQELTIVTTSSAAVYKGYDMILKTAKILWDNMGCNFIWKVFGNVAPDFYEKKLDIKHGEVNVELCGVATPEVLVETFSKCTLYFHPSYIDNSPNSICEAQICGCPIVACSAGGVDSLVSHGLSGFLVPANDPYMAASRILQLYRDRDLNECMGLASKQIASERHNRDSIVNGLLDVYNMIIENK